MLESLGRRRSGVGSCRAIESFWVRLSIGALDAISSTPKLATRTCNHWTRIVLSRRFQVIRYQDNDAEMFCLETVYSGLREGPLERRTEPVYINNMSLL